MRRHHAGGNAKQSALESRPDDPVEMDRVSRAAEAGDKARAERKALQENDVILREAREAASAPLPAEPGEITVLEGLDEQSLLGQRNASSIVGSI